MNYTLLNLGSVILGLLAWVLPWMPVKGKILSAIRRRGLHQWVSFTCCALALWLQLCYQWHLADIGDWSALGDTAGAVMKVSAFLVLTTAADNLLARVLWRQEDEA